MAYVRQKEDPWNLIILGDAAGGFLSMRQGFGVASRSAIFGVVLLDLIEGAGILLNKVLSALQNMPIMMEELAPNMASMLGISMGQLPGQALVPLASPTLPASSSSSSSSSSWFGGLFGGGKKQEIASSVSKTEVLESFDASPMPSFEYE